VSTDAHTPVPVRPSLDERERVVRLLRDRSVEGRLSTDTFAGRVGLAYSATSRSQLAALTADVRPPGGARRLLIRAVEWVSGLQSELESAWARPRAATLALPRAEGVRLSIGRAPNADCVIPEECVSRRHAQLWREGERWFLRDLGSRNGTRVNGMLAIEDTEVRPGDRVDLGGACYRLRSI
jgi:FHA domain/Domain of unknown function (DUF1707)